MCHSFDRRQVGDRGRGVMVGISPTGGFGREPFHPIPSTRAHEQVVEQIAFAILSGAYNPGERLPNIEALARLMRVSKPVVGAALKVLAGASVVRAIRGVGGGLVVETNEVPEHILAMSGPLGHVDLAGIVEARRPVEMQIAQLAARRARPEDFAAMEEAIERLRDHREGELSMMIRLDHQFHYIMGRAARSSALALYQHQVLEHLFVRMRGYFSNPRAAGAIVRVHEDTLAALRSRDPTEITRAMDQHMRPLEEMVRSIAR
ncbi:FCD domain-containing protein [Mesorhizobium sp. LHD-90]|uniref:FadR/GntR family transcriptional regulator n=1 Tax=Mesorhizobium sp. LHD-90 TaxID=3071414 RepID=UPI0027DFB648|nr:FCD domain-containing protein [Mesorhizobium sp. LHD-90]MDQ6434840.1 FCD domain-containing protein [Mesorhizobium sp. LHD-90]